MKWLDKLKTMKKDKLILLILAGILLVVIKLPAKNTVKTKSYEYNIQNSAADKTTTDYGTSMEKQLLESFQGSAKTEIEDYGYYAKNGKELLLFEEEV